MKFGHELLQEQQTAPREFKGAWVQYKMLKKYLKYRLQRADSPAVAVEREFLKLLQNQLKAVDRKFETQLDSIITKSGFQLGGKRCLGALIAILRGHPTALLSRSHTKLAQQAHWLQRYAQLNSAALRKIAKKRDKRLGGSLGQQFLQACLRGETAIGSFLSGPLLKELAAVEELLLSRQALRPTLALPPPAEKGDEMGKKAATKTADRAHESGDAEIAGEHSCAICLDLLYQPVALDCGHIFCSRCALATAMGHDRLIGDGETLLFRVGTYTAAHQGRRCPCCRATGHGMNGMNVFWNLCRMEHLEQLIKHKYTAEWQRRKFEDDAQQAELKAALPPICDCFGKKQAPVTRA